MPVAPASFEKVLTALGPLRDRLTALVDAGLASGQFQESPELFVQWQAVNPKSTETGPEIAQSSRMSTVRSTWTRARLKVLTAAHSLPEYAAAESALAVRVGWMRSVTDWFTLNLADALLSDTARPCAAASGLIEQVTAVVEGQPLRARATVDLGGIRVASPGMELHLGTTTLTLRRPDLADLQPELDEHMAMLEGRELRHNMVSAIASIDMDWSSPMASRTEVERLQSLLRLFAVASARYLRVNEVLTAPLHEDMGTLTVGSDEHSYEQSTIQPGDLQRLQAFAAAVWVKLPIGQVGLPEAEPTPVTTAFRRYCDALLRDGTILERRFASAVMGLESLYLPAKQDGELSFRLRTGVSRVMEELGFDGRTVEAEVAFCYGVRSAYVHGGHLSGKLRASGEKKFGNLQNLLRRLLNYLRISIVLSVLLELPKEDLLTAINDAMVSAKGSLGLAQILAPARKLIVG
jgi:hypothetical protein